MAPQPPTFAIPPALPASGTYPRGPPHPFLTILEIAVAIAAVCIILVFVIWFIPQHHQEMWKGIHLKRRRSQSAGVSQSAFRDGVALEEDQDLWVLREGDEGDERNIWDRDEESAVGNGGKYDREEV